MAESKRGALVTAAAQGIGRGIALALAADGYRVLCCDLEQQRESGEATVAAVKQGGGDAAFFPCDVTRSADMAAAVAKVVELFGSLDASVATVGGGERKPVSEQSFEAYEKAIATTQHASFYQTQLSAQQMKAQGRGGSIVIIGSIMADFAFPGAAAYSMAKCAIRQLGKTAAHELAADQIRVNVLQPGYIDTPGERRLSSEEQLAHAATLIPLKRLGQPSDIGATVSFLCSAAASYVTGAVIDVDGGFKVALQLGHKQGGGTDYVKDAED